MKIRNLFPLFLPLFIIFIMILFIAVPQALSRSPDTSPRLILNVDQSTMATFSSIENQLYIYTETEHRQEIILFRESLAPMLISIDQDIATVIIRSVLLL